LKPLKLWGDVFAYLIEGAWRDRAGPWGPPGGVTASQEGDVMNAKPWIWVLTTASVLMWGAVGTVTTQATQHASHSMSEGARRTPGPLPEAVRQATEDFRDVNAAIAAGYVRNGGCVSGPEEGAMGVHYANFALFDAELDVARPEVLVYEPRNGRLHLVAAEYVTPAAAWDPVNQPATPDLMGHLLHFAPGPNRYGPDAFYELHVWAWKENPRGAFADWNPKVSCADWPLDSQ
jgi:hypothetical protein